MELMDASTEKFYRSMHSLANVTYDEMNYLLCRLTNNVSRSLCLLCNFLFFICLVNNQITSALSFLKSRRILHRDVKPANMLVNKHGIFKLCDFGICGAFRAVSLIMDAVKGTCAYLPVKKLISLFLFLR